MEYLAEQHVAGIIERAKHGDHDAFSWLYTTYFTQVYRYAYYRTGSAADAEDITQSVFLRAYESIGRYSHRGISPLAYFYTIARNAVIDHRRKKQVGVMPDEQLSTVVDSRDSPEENASRGYEGEYVRSKIRLLPEEQQEVVTLKFINELSNAEIAAILNKSEDAVRQLQSRGLRSLRTFLINDHEY